MPRFCLIIADAARARIYAVEPVERDLPGRGVALHERADLVSLERRLRPSEILADSGTGGGHAGTSFGLDDHRDEHMREIDRRFAGEIATHAGAVVGAAELGRVVLVASPRMLGELRKVLPAQVKRAAIEELALDLTRLTTPQVHDHLAALGVMPARERATAER